MPRYSNENTNSSSNNNNKQNRYNPYSNINTLLNSVRNSRPSSSTTSNYQQQQQPKSTTSSPLNVRYNSSGYRQFNSNSTTGSGWQFTHRRVAEKKIGREISPSEQVHHINRIKTDNRYENLVVLDEAIHHHLHSSNSEKTACFRCGRTSHYAGECFAKSDVFGRSVVGSGSRTSYYSDSSDDDCFGGCSRCGRSSHTSSNCYARSDRYGNDL